MEDSKNIEYIDKKLLHAGRSKCNFQDGTKVIFHYKSETVEGKELDNSRKWSKPIDLLLGKKFKLEVWEACIKTMKEGEVAEFTIDEKLLSPYPVVSKTLRDFEAKKAGKPVEEKHHCCGMGFKESLGYADLDELVTKPQNIRFIIELLKVETDGMYQKEFWAMCEEERVASIQILREEGNELYKNRDYTSASRKYFEAIGRLDNLMLKEKPGDIEWTEFNDKKSLLLLNYAQCQLLLGEYYSAIEHCTDVLKHEPDNVKALFRRGKSYVEVFSGKEAREDLNRVIVLDPSLEGGCKKLINKLDSCEKQKLQEDKATYKKLFS